MDAWMAIEEEAEAKLRHNFGQGWWQRDGLAPGTREGFAYRCQWCWKDLSSNCMVYDHVNSKEHIRRRYHHSQLTGQIPPPPTAPPPPTTPPPNVARPPAAPPPDVVQPRMQIISACSAPSSVHDVSTPITSIGITSSAVTGQHPLPPTTPPPATPPPNVARPPATPPPDVVQPRMQVISACSAPSSVHDVSTPSTSIGITSGAVTDQHPLPPTTPPPATFPPHVAPRPEIPPPDVVQPRMQFVSAWSAPSSVHDVSTCSGISITAGAVVRIHGLVDAHLAFLNGASATILQEVSHAKQWLVRVEGINEVCFTLSSDNLQSGSSASSCISSEDDAWTSAVLAFRDFDSSPYGSEYLTFCQDELLLRLQHQDEDEDWCYARKRNSENQTCDGWVPKYMFQFV